MQALFEVLCGPLARPVTPGMRFGRYRMVSFDGCSSLKVPDTGRNRAWLDRLAHGGYPQLELMTLVETGTRAMIGSVPVRIVNAQITVTCTDGTVLEASHRLVTTLTNARRHPAGALISLYHQRWEHESAYYALRHTLLRGRVLRSGDPAGVEQEMWALLTLYQLLRIVMVDAAQSRPGTDPDRCGFTIAFHAARDLVIQAEGILPEASDPIGGIGRRVLARLLPPRRPRLSTRKVKSPISRYGERLDDGRPNTSRAITNLDIAILEPVPNPPLPATSRDDRHTSVAEHRSTQVLALLHTEPDRHWNARDIALHLGDITLGTMYRQLSRWATTGLIHKIGPGLYTALPDSPPP
ncbi:hypothetical protein [Streptosporangium sp. NBC_01469]|uniref:hypothetical protein n=1 Tax=Streptosporangium sp. NBC_01469 TaxID=2903898 RepID=UPI002E2883D5|nr:hypothetical protein [Streptosporangium sp. NBC_01469]